MLQCSFGGVSLVPGRVLPGPGGVLLGPWGCLPGPGGGGVVLPGCGGFFLVLGGFSLVWGGSPWSQGGFSLVPGGGFSLVVGGSPWSQGGSHWSAGGGVSAWSWGVGSPETTPPVNRITHTCKNITLATTSLRPVIIDVAVGVQQTTIFACVLERKLIIFYSFALLSHSHL